MRRAARVQAQRMVQEQTKGQGQQATGQGWAMRPLPALPEHPMQMQAHCQYHRHPQH